MLIHLVLFMCFNDFQTIQSILNTDPSPANAKTLTIFPNYSVYFKLDYP